MLVDIFRASTKPRTIIFPYPIIPLIVGLVAGDCSNFWKPILLTFLFYPAINLWNHINDAEDDFSAGKSDLFVDKNARKFGMVMVIILYLLSGALSYIFGGKICFLLFTIVFVLTFLYSDNMITKLRIKRHFIGELVTYVISIPVYILLMYTTVTNMSLHGLTLALIFTPVLLSTVFIKDLKDISADKVAGFKTLGVVFEPEMLVKLFSMSLFIYFVLILIAFKDSLYIYSSIPIFSAIFGSIGLIKNDWLITRRTIKFFLLMFYSGLLSIIIFASIAIFSCILKF